ncbi:hypothetical protein A5804_000646 [Enterococcus faecium]|uniref:Uncharacterized protein n=1 Tax=Enterococcus faecium TaxID=1352 RepID=A0AB73PLM1_ENTFC|nr:hypothetical protein A5804_000646 [Enterococcus faecium]
MIQSYKNFWKQAVIKKHLKETLRGGGNIELL